MVHVFGFNEKSTKKMVGNQGVANNAIYWVKL